ncbi:UDP-N-acetylmuramoylalanine--D-glutamate ligase [Azospirillaceae bacterium]
MIKLSLQTNRPYAVMGLGKSGLATATELLKTGVAVWAWDDNADRRAVAAAAGASLRDLTTCRFEEVGALVLSPGIPHTYPAPHPVAARARLAGVPIIGDVELLGRAQPEARYLGITGSNGKSTTTALAGHILTVCGRPVGIGGNLGTPVLTLPALGRDGCYVLELSSYQLELTFSIAYDVAVLLNITPDHLDRHGGMDGYIHAKTLMFSTRRETSSVSAPQTAVIGVDDAHCRAIASRLANEGWRVIPISAEGPVVGGVYVHEGRLIDETLGGAGEVMDLSGVSSLVGKHNGQNAAAAYAATRALGVTPEEIACAMRSFPGLAHRQQLIAEIDNVRFINDSKATNADAAAKALTCYDDIYWILGGKPKEGGLDGLEPFMSHVREAFLIGVASDAFAAWLERRAPGVVFHRCEVLTTAVTQAAMAAQRAAQTAMRRPVVLLSPACASFDQFTDFEARGAAFIAATESWATLQATPTIQTTSSVIDAETGGC